MPKTRGANPKKLVLNPINVQNTSTFYKKRKLMKHTKTFYIYLILLHFALATVVIKSNFIPQLESKLGVTKPPEFNEYFKETLIYQQRMDASIPDNAVIFIGDSITQSLAVSAVAPISVNYGIGSDTTVGVLKRLPSYKNSIKRAKAVVITVGLSDLSKRSHDEIIQNFQKIINSIPRNITIIFNAVFPVDERIENNAGLNQKIRQLNTELKVLMKLRPNLFFINSGDKLRDTDNNLSNKYHTGDGIHLNPAAYKIWITDLKATLNLRKL